MKHFESGPFKHQSPETQKILELTKKIFEYIKNNFNLSLHLEQKLDKILSNLPDLIKSQYLPPVISFAEILEPSSIITKIQETAGICYIDPHTFEPKFIVIKDPNDNSYSIAEKITHEVLHYIGTSVSEVQKLTSQDNIYEMESILSSLNEVYNTKFKFSEVIEYRTGFLKYQDFIIVDELSGIKYLLKLPSYAEDEIFYESAIDYFSKEIVTKIIKEMSKEEIEEAIFTAGYPSRKMLALCIYNVAYLLKEINQKNYDENIEELEKYLRFALITGDLTQFIQEVNKVRVDRFLERLKELSVRFQEKDKKFADKIEDVLTKVISKVEELPETLTFDVIKLLVFEFYCQ